MYSCPTSVVKLVIRRNKHKKTERVDSILLFLLVKTYQKEVGVIATWSVKQVDGKTFKPKVGI